MAYAIVLDAGEDLGEGVLGTVIERVGKREEAREAFKRSVKQWESLLGEPDERSLTMFKLFPGLEERLRKEVKRLVGEGPSSLYLVHGPRGVLRMNRPVARADCWAWTDSNGREHKNNE